MPLVYLLALLSGAAALMYEVTWARMLALTFGSTTHSAAAVVVGFLGGAGVGAALYHRLRGHATRPLRVYALLEFGIAASTAILALTFYALPERFAVLSRSIPSRELYVTLRFALGLSLIVLPSMLMGATFPALCRAAIHSAEGLDRRLGWIYGVNTLGAAVGALLAGLVLIERLGLRGTTWVANGLNIAVGIAALIFLRSRGGVIPDIPGPTAIPSSLPRAATGAVLFLSGMATLAYEILWFRGLRYLVGASSYAFAIVLFTFLTGLGLGALLLDRAARRPRPERDLIGVQCLIAVLAVGGIGLLSLALSEPALLQHLSIFVPEVRASPWLQRLGINLAVSVVVLLPATLFMGLSFPLATRLYLGDVKRLDTRVGRAYLLANLGSAVGSIGAALVLLPLLGVVRGTVLCAGISLSSAALLSFSSRRERGSGLVLLGGSAAVVATLALLLPATLAVRGENLLEERPLEQIFLREGDVATVQVLRDPEDPARLAMAIDGFKIGWSEGFRGTPNHLKQILLADLPMVLDARVQSTLSIGLGSAATLATLASYPRIERLEAVEISAAVVEGSRLFEESSVLADPRTSLAVDDAVHHLLRHDRRYDLVSSDGKQDPFFSGNASLLCREFYQSVSKRLGEHGLLVQWFPIGTLSSDLSTIVATLADTFPHVDAFSFPPASMLLVAGNEPLSARPRMPADEYARLPVAGRLAPYGIDGPASLLMNWTAGREGLLAAFGDAPLSTWDRPILDHSPFKASAEEWRTAYLTNLRLLVQAGQATPPDGGPNLSPAERAPFAAARLLREAWLASLQGQMQRARKLAQSALAADPGNPQARAFLAFLAQSAPDGR